jgi:cytochrome c oxidase cbb3-type subunit 3
MFESQFSYMQIKKTSVFLSFIGLSVFLIFTNHSPKMNSSHNLSKGKQVFDEKCSGCHGEKGEGAFGPNLTDNYFIHGHHVHAVVHIVKHGNKKGMTAFNHVLNHHQIHNVAHYVHSLKGSNVAGGKAPQGKYHK